LLGLPDVDLGDGRAVAAHGVPAPQAESGEEGDQHHQAEADAGDETGACPQPDEDGARATTELTHRYPPWKIRSSPSWSGRRGGETRRRSYTVPRAGVSPGGRARSAASFGRGEEPAERVVDRGIAGEHAAGLGQQVVPAVQGGHDAAGLPHNESAGRDVPGVE